MKLELDLPEIYLNVDWDKIVEHIFDGCTNGYKPDVIAAMMRSYETKYIKMEAKE